MSTHILTSMFPNGLNSEQSELFRTLLSELRKFAFVASEFEKMHEKTDKYFHFFLKMFQESGISFEVTCVVDGRMTAEDAQKAVKEADVVWLSGGNTPVEFAYLKKYGLDTVLRQHKGVVIGMSAGSINMAKNAICTLSCGHAKQEIYEGLGYVEFSVEPHFVREKLSDELLELSNEYLIYGLCDDSIIVSKDGQVSFYGEVYRLKGGQIEHLESGCE